MDRIPRRRRKSDQHRAKVADNRALGDGLEDVFEEPKCLQDYAELGVLERLLPAAMQRRQRIDLERRVGRVTITRMQVSFLPYDFIAA